MHSTSSCCMYYLRGILCLQSWHSSSTSWQSSLRWLSNRIRITSLMQNSQTSIPYRHSLRWLLISLRAIQASQPGLRHMISSNSQTFSCPASIPYTTSFKHPLRLFWHLSLNKFSSWYLKGIDILRNWTPRQRSGHCNWFAFSTDV